MSTIIDINLIRNIVNTNEVANVVYNGESLKKLIVDGGVLWSLPIQDEGTTISLEVAKITSNTYASDTTYENESFVLLNIYPTTNGTVRVTYGGVTKTITDTSGVEEPNAQAVFFGTFRGVTDETETPASGTLTIEGNCRGFACGTYAKAKATTAYCSCITAINTWGDVELVPNYGFYNCKSLSSAIIPDSVTSIGDRAFYYCNELKNVSLSKSLTSLGSYAFIGCSALEYIFIPNGVVSINQEAFEYCYALSQIVISEGVTSIGNLAFRECSALRNIDIPNSVTSIGASAFYDCTKLETVNIGSGITSIEGAFGNCTRLTKVTIQATTPPTITASAFASVDLSTFSIVVPSGCGEAYKTAENWSEYADYITEA